MSGEKKKGQLALKVPGHWQEIELHVTPDSWQLIRPRCEIWGVSSVKEQGAKIVRFQATEAEVLYLGRLRKRLHQFYESALKVYEKKPAGWDGASEWRSDCLGNRKIKKMTGCYICYISKNAWHFCNAVIWSIWYKLQQQDEGEDDRQAENNDKTNRDISATVRWSERTKNLFQMKAIDLLVRERKGGKEHEKNLAGIIICLVILCVCAIAAAETVGGTTYTTYCGSNAGSINISWSLDLSTGILNITGTGGWGDYPYGGFFAGFPCPPWGGNDLCDYLVSEDPEVWEPIVDYRSSIKKVIIHEGVTSIAAPAFANCTNLT